MSNLFAGSDTLLLHRRLNFRRRNMTVLRNSLTRYTARHLRIKRLVQFIFAGPVHYNVLTTCATLLCRACLDEITCVAEHYLTLRIGCERHGSKNPLPFPFSTLTQSTICTQATPQGKRVFKEGRNRRCLPFLPPPRVRRSSVRFSSGSLTNKDHSINLNYIYS